MTRLLLCIVLVATAAQARSRGLAVKCIQPNLMGRTETVPRTQEFTLGAEAFDRATVDWRARRYGDSARGFLKAAEHFARDGAEGNWKYAWQNSALAWAAANRVAEGKSAFEAAAANEKDPDHAKALRAAASGLSAKGACP